MTDAARSDAPTVTQSARTGGKANDEVRRIDGYANMDKSEKLKVTWFTAYKVLSKGKSPAIGKYPGWKSFVLNISVVAPIAIAFVGGNQIRTVSGAIPPDVPVIQATGKFLQMHRGQASWVAFVAEDGRTYNMERGTTIRDNNNLPHGNPPPTTYVEGFLRENGRGYFWPTMIKMPDGKILLYPKQSIANFQQFRRRVYDVTAFYILLNVILWILALKFIGITRRNLILGK
jgi:hypothetical protein